MKLQTQAMREKRSAMSYKRLFRRTDREFARERARAVRPMLVALRSLVGFNDVPQD